MPNPKEYDMNFRPERYWEQDASCLANIKGQFRRKQIKKAIKEGSVEEIPSHIFAESLDESVREFTSHIHPMLMGGEYLPDYMPNEVEIARICLASTTSDVISIRAFPTGKRINYRVVDEYWDEIPTPIYNPGQKSSARPLTLREMIRLIDTTNNPQQCFEELGLVHPLRKFEMEEDGIDTMKGFVRVKSDFYPELVRWYDEAEREMILEYKKKEAWEDYPELALLELTDDEIKILEEEYGSFEDPVKYIHRITIHVSKGKQEDERGFDKLIDRLNKISSLGAEYFNIRSFSDLIKKYGRPTDKKYFENINNNLIEKEGDILRVRRENKFLADLEEREQIQKISPMSPLDFPPFLKLHELSDAHIAGLGKWAKKLPGILSCEIKWHRHHGGSMPAPFRVFLIQWQTSEGHKRFEFKPKNPRGEGEGWSYGVEYTDYPTVQEAFMTAFKDYRGETLE